MSNHEESDFSGLERVEPQSKPRDTPGKPMVSVVADGDIVNFLKNARDTLGNPSYIEFYKSSTKVFVEPYNSKQGALNPHKVRDRDYQGLTSFAWHECDETGAAELKYDDERRAYYFDTAELTDYDR